MSELKTLARPYALAAYEFAKQANEVDKWKVMLSNLRELVLMDSVQQILLMPNLDKDEFLSAIAPFLKKGMNEAGLNFLKLLLAQRRLMLMPIIYELFDLFKVEAENSVHVSVTTAIALNEDRRLHLIKKIEQHLNRTVFPVFYVDGRIIGGLVFRVGEEYVLDASLKTKLDRLRIQF